MGCRKTDGIERSAAIAEDFRIDGYAEDLVRVTWLALSPVGDPGYEIVHIPVTSVNPGDRHAQTTDVLFEARSSGTRATKDTQQPDRADTARRPTRSTGSHGCRHRMTGVSIEMGTSTACVQVPFVPRRVWSVSPHGSRVVILETDVAAPEPFFRVNAVDETGATIFDRSFPFQPEPIPSAAIDSAIRARVGVSSTIRLSLG